MPEAGVISIGQRSTADLCILSETPRLLNRDMLLHERLTALEASSVPTWVFDADHFRQRWANRAALVLWRANTPEELYERDYSDMSESTRTRMRGYIAGFRQGQNAEEIWTLYPHGEPVTMKLFFSGIQLDDNRTGALIQAFETAERPGPDLIRSIEALRHTSLMITLLDIDGKVILQNPAATRAFGGMNEFALRFQDSVVSDALLDAAQSGDFFALETMVQTDEGNRWHAIEARTLHDPATGKTIILVQHTDETLRRQAEQRADNEAKLAVELRGTLALVEKQKAQIFALSAPMLEVSAHTIAVPIIGTLDAARGLNLQERVLSLVVQRGATSVILDLTGADALSTSETAVHVASLSRAIRLLGAKTIVTGISPVLARTLVTSSLDMGDVLMLRTLRDGIAIAEKRRSNSRIST